MILQNKVSRPLRRWCICRCINLHKPYDSSYCMFSKLAACPSTIHLLFHSTFFLPTHKKPYVSSGPNWHGYVPTTTGPFRVKAKTVAITPGCTVKGAIKVDMELQKTSLKATLQGCLGKSEKVKTESSRLHVFFFFCATIIRLEYWGRIHEWEDVR